MVGPLDILMPLLVVLLNMGLGASMCFDDIKVAAKRWKGLLVAVLCQFGIMPLTAFSMAKGLGVTNLEAISMVVVGTCPGGALSNLYAYYSNSDLPLSILATITSTLTGTILMPLLVSVYSRPFMDAKTKIPPKAMLIPVVMVVVAVAIGMTVNHHNKACAKKLEKVGSVVGAVFMGLATAAGFVEVMTTHPSWKIWLSAIALMPIGGFCGFWISRLAGLPRASAQTVCFETGLQNAAVGVVVLALAFEDQDMLKEAMIFPLVFMLFNNIIGPLMVALFRVTAPKVKENEPDADTKKPSQETEATEETGEKEAGADAKEEAPPQQQQEPAAVAPDAAV